MPDEPQPYDPYAPPSAAYGQIPHAERYGAMAPHPGYAPASGQVAPRATIGQVRGTGLAILLFVVTFGIYGLYWFYVVHDEMRRHKGQGLGGGLALVLAFFITIVMPYLTSQEVGEMYERRGQRRPVSGATGLWYFPGSFLIVGPLVWFILTNNALNDYWRSVGAR